MSIQTKLQPLSLIAAGVALSIASSAINAQTTYTYMAAEGTAPAHRQSFNAATDISESGVVVGTNFQWTPPAEPIALDPIGNRFTSIIAVQGINASGTMVGGANFPGDDNFSVFAREDGQVRNLGTGLGAGSTAGARDINDAGEIVGRRALSRPGDFMPYIYRDGQFTDLGSLGGREGEARAINEVGQVVGSSEDRRGRTAAFIWENGQMTNLGALSRGRFVRTVANGLNDSGEVVGRSEISERVRGRRVFSQRAFVWQNGTMENLGALDGDSSEAFDINNSGTVVGSYRSTVRAGFNSTEKHAVVWENGEAIDLNAPGVVTNLPGNITLSSANAINDDGVIVGETCFRECAPGKDRTSVPFVLIPNN